MGTKPPGNTTQSSNSQNNIIVMQHLSRCQNKRLAHMGNLNCCKNQVGEECPWSSLVLDLMLLGSCRSTLSRSLSAVSVSSLSLSWVISVKSAYCGNMALDDFAILLILSQKNSHRLLTLTTNYSKQFPSVLTLFFSIWDLTFLFFHLWVIGPDWSLLVHLILISIWLCCPVFPHPRTQYFPTNCSNYVVTPFCVLVTLLPSINQNDFAVCWEHTLSTSYCTAEVQNLCAQFWFDFRRLWGLLIWL